MHIDLYALEEPERQQFIQFLMSQIEFKAIGVQSDALYTPIVLRATVNQAEALLDHVWRTIPRTNLMITIIDVTQKAVLKIPNDLVDILNSNEAFYKPIAQSNLYIFHLNWNPSLSRWDICYGFMPYRLIVEFMHGIRRISSYLETDHNTSYIRIVRESLIRLYQITNIHKYLAASLIDVGLANIVDMKRAPVIDPKGYYLVLGLDPNILLYQPFDLVRKRVVKGYKMHMNRYIEARDTCDSNALVYSEYLEAAAQAYEMLADYASCEAYTNWL